METDEHGPAPRVPRVTDSSHRGCTIGPGAAAESPIKTRVCRTLLARGTALESAADHLSCPTLRGSLSTMERLPAREVYQKASGLTPLKAASPNQRLDNPRSSCEPRAVASVNKAVVTPAA